MSDALLVADSHNRVVDPNPAARKLLAEQGELVGKSLGLTLGQDAAALLTGGLQETHGVITLQNHGPHGLDALCTPAWTKEASGTVQRVGSNRPIVIN